MQNHGNGRTDTDDADPAGRGNLPFFRQEPLCKFGTKAQQRNNDDASEDKTQVIHDNFPIHDRHLFIKIRPENVLRA